MLINNNPLGMGVVFNPVVCSLFTQYFAGTSSPVPPTQLLWVEDLTGDQMVTEDLSQQYVFVGA
jgi:hypothetical protein